MTRFLCWALNPGHYLSSFQVSSCGTSRARWLICGQSHQPLDKAALPWKRDCLSPHPSYHAFTPQSPTELQTIALPSFDSSTSPVQPVHPLLPHPLISPSSLESEGVPPIGLFVGVFSTDKAFERRQMIRTTYARKGSGGGADGLQSVRVRFILGRPKPRYKALVELEMEGPFEPSEFIFLGTDHIQLTRMYSFLTSLWRYRRSRHTREHELGQDARLLCLGRR